MTDRLSRISGVCWKGQHARCSGWLVVPDEGPKGRVAGTDQSIKCDCSVCDHAPVERDRHLHEPPTRRSTYGIH